MSTSNPITEARVRVVCHLPNNITLPYQADAYNRVLLYVQGLKESQSHVTGFTQIERTLGQWFNDKDNQWVEDTCNLLIVDFEGDDEDPTLLNRIASIRRCAFDSYRECDPDHEGEDEIWLAMHPITRFAEPK